MYSSKDFLNEQWSRFEEIEASFNFKKVPTNVDVIMELTVSDDYPDIYHKDEGTFKFCMVTTSPDDSWRAKEYSFTLKDENGNWKSEKVDGYYHFRFPLINELNVTESGDYRFNIENKYTRDPLYGVKNITIRCVKSGNK